MTSTRTGHFVQIFIPLGSYSDRKWVEVEGRKWPTHYIRYPELNSDGWFYTSRELNRKDAVKYARAYRKAGFSARVLFRGNSDGSFGGEVVEKFYQKGFKG